MAQKTQNLGLEVFDFATDSTPSFVNGLAGLENSNMHKIDEAITNKVTLNNESIQNVNFIRNEVVQDGLGVCAKKYTGNLSTNIMNTDSSVLHTVFEMNVGEDLMPSDVVRLFGVSTWTNFMLFKSGSYRDYAFFHNTNVYSKVKPNKGDIVQIIKIGKNVKVLVNDQLTLDTTLETCNGQVYQFLDTGCTYIKNVMAYSRVLTSQEIQHNFSVLNNTSSINKINDYAISTDTDHIEDRTGRTAEQINRVFYKNMCKEFTSNGEAITVNNGMDGYVLSGKIEGQTVKNYVEMNYTNSSADTTTSSYVTFTKNDDENKASVLVNQEFTSSSWLHLRLGKGLEKYLEPNKTYYVWAEIECNGSFQSSVSVSNASGNYLMTDRKILDHVTGKNIVKIPLTTVSDLTTNKSETYVVFAIGKTIGVKVGNKIEIKLLGVVESENIKLGSGLKTGLNSTQAVISNNGLKYSFYSTIEDKLANRVIDLGGLDGARNISEIKEDGSATWTKASNNIVLNGNETWVANIDMGTTMRFVTTISDKLNRSTFICDRFSVGEIGNINDIRQMMPVSDNRIIIQLLKTEASTVEQLKAWLQANPVIVRYQLATPIVTTIDKSLVPAILTQATNTFQFGDAVAPYSVTIQVPCTDDIKKSYQVTLLNNYTQTVGTATPAVNLANTGIIRLQMDLTAPATGMNATLFTLAQELRPITTQRIPVFVNGVCQLATIDKTTGNVNLASVPSASANIYIKTDYRRDI